MTPGACDWCGEPYVAKAGNQRYCSYACKDRAWNARRPKATPKPPRPDPAAVARARTFRRRTERIARQAAGGWIRRNGVRTGLYGQRAPRAFIAGVCPDCGEQFVRQGQVGLGCCSAKCTARQRKAASGYHKFHPVRRLAVYARDGWRCWLCGWAVDMNRPDHDLGPSLDHVVPRSLGGEHVEANLRLAHRWCNSMRGDEVDPDLQRDRLMDYLSRRGLPIPIHAGFGAADLAADLYRLALTTKHPTARWGCKSGTQEALDWLERQRAA